MVGQYLLVERRFSPRRSNLFGKINFINGQREDARRLPFKAVLVFLLWAFPFLGLRGLSVLPVLLHEDRLGFFLGRS